MGKKVSNVYEFIGKRFINKNQELEYEVIEYSGKDERGNLLYKIRFLESSYEKVYRKYNIVHGLVYDLLKRKEMLKITIDTDDIIGNKYTSLNQKLEYEVIEFVEKKHDGLYYKIRFLKSKNERIYERYKIVHGIVSDNSYRRTFDRSNIIGNVYTNRKGLEYTVISEDIKSGRYVVRFNKSGYIKHNCYRSEIKRGEIKDRS